MQHSDLPIASRYINSVSDLLYSTDEIEYLLDETIRDLEPTSCKPEDIQDFEIAGSRTGGCALSAADCSAAAGCECESPLGTVNSWDSHSHYRQRAASPDLSLYSGVIVYCDHTHLKSPTGIFRILLLVTSMACLTCLCTSGTVKVGLFMLPLAGRIRFMMFVSIFSILVTCIVLFLDISHIIYVFPFNWGKLNAYFYLSLSLLFLLASSLVFHMIFLSEAFSWVPKWTHHQLLVTGCLGYICCFQSAIIALIQRCQIGEYQPVAEDPSSLNLQERELSPIQHNVNSTSPDHVTNNQTSTVHNYKPMVNYAVASTSKQYQNHHLPQARPQMQRDKSKLNTSCMDDVQPCSSKMNNTDDHRVA